MMFVALAVCCSWERGLAWSRCDRLPWHNFIATALERVHAQHSFISAAPVLLSPSSLFYIFCKLISL